jgi:hypothetical protein
MIVEDKQVPQFDIEDLVPDHFKKDNLGARERYAIGKWLAEGHDVYTLDYLQSKTGLKRTLMSKWKYKFKEGFRFSGNGGRPTVISDSVKRQFHDIIREADECGRPKDHKECQAIVTELSQKEERTKEGKIVSMKTVKKLMGEARVHVSAKRQRIVSNPPSDLSETVTKV